MAQHGKSKAKAEILEALNDSDSQYLVKTLDDLKGSYAVKYMLEVLLDREAGHTINAVNDLLSKS